MKRRPTLSARLLAEAAVRFRTPGDARLIRQAAAVVRVLEARDPAAASRISIDWDTRHAVTQARQILETYGPAEAGHNRRFNRQDV